MVGQEKGKRMCKKEGEEWLLTADNRKWFQETGNLVLLAQWNINPAKLAKKVKRKYSLMLNELCCLARSFKAVSESEKQENKG